MSTKRRSGIPTGNAGEYFVIGELLRRGFDAQLADRNTQEYDVLVGQSTDKALRKVQVKSVRAAPWYVRISQFEKPNLDMVTIYVLLGSQSCNTQSGISLPETKNLQETCNSQSHGRKKGRILGSCLCHQSPHLRIGGRLSASNTN